MTLGSVGVLRSTDDGGVGPNDLIRPMRQRFTVEHKLSILDEYDRLTDPGSKGALLRRERRGPEAAAVIEATFAELQPLLGTRAACLGVGRPRATPYRRRRPPTLGPARGSTMYWLLRIHNEARRRGRQATHPPRGRPELIATAPNVVWSWDIVKLNLTGIGRLRSRGKTGRYVDHQ